ncbi:Y-box-binding protein 1 [Taenia crassiceps]|uniref:Y-box-binding protein 1 n=1 Tax=Taenia crassiceps TaxID=6207 RepID=A0ABR4QDH5_9CEST
MTAEVAQSAEVQPSVPERKRFDILKVIVENVTGTVKWFSVRRHYGFIQRDDNKEDVFVHRTAITASRSRFPTLKNGESVEFSVVETASGVNAASVTGPNGRQVQGARFFRRPKPVESGEGQPKLNGTTQAGGDVEGTRQRGGPRRMRRGRRPFRPGQNAMGDGENTGGEQGEELGGGLEGSRAPRQRPRRFRGGGRGRGSQRSNSIRQQMNGEDGAAINDEEGGVSRQQQGGPRRGGGGRFRRGGGSGRMRRGGGAASTRDGEGHVENSVAGEHAESLEKKVEDMSLEAKGEASEKPKESAAAEQQMDIERDVSAEGVTKKVTEATGASN